MLIQFKKSQQAQSTNFDTPMSLADYCQEKGLNFSTYFLNAVKALQSQALNQCLQQNPDLVLSKQMIARLNQALVQTFEQHHRLFDEYLSELPGHKREHYYNYIMFDVLETVFDVQLSPLRPPPIHDIFFLLLQGQYPANFHFSNDSVLGIKNLHSQCLAAYFDAKSLTDFKNIPQPELQRLNHELGFEFKKLQLIFGPCLKKLDKAQQEACYKDMVISALELVFDVHLAHKPLLQKQDTESSQEEQKTDSSQEEQKTNSKMTRANAHSERQPKFHITDLQSLHASEKAKHTANRIKRRMEVIYEISLSEQTMERIAQTHQAFLSYHYQISSCTRVDLNWDKNFSSQFTLFLNNILEFYKNDLATLAPEQKELFIYHLYLITLEETYPQKLDFLKNTLTETQIENFRLSKLRIHEAFLQHALHWSLHHTYRITPPSIWVEECLKAYSSHLRHFLDKKNTKMIMDEFRLYDLAPCLQFFIRLIENEPLFEKSKKDKARDSSKLPAFNMTDEQQRQAYKHFILAIHIFDKFNYDQAVYISDTLPIVNQDYVSMSINQMNKEESKALVTLDYQLRYQDEPELNHKFLFKIVESNYCKQELDAEFAAKMQTPFAKSSQALNHTLKKLSTPYKDDLVHRKNEFLISIHQFMAGGRTLSHDIAHGYYPEEEVHKKKRLKR